MEPITLPKEIAQELFRKYGAGFEENGEIKAHPLEALYFIERGKLSLEGESFASLMEKASREDSLAAEKYSVLKYLRSMGYITRPSFAKGERWLRVYRKGFRPGEDRTQFLLKVVPEGWQPSLSELLSDVKAAAGIRKELVYAIARSGSPLFLKVARTSFD